MNMKLGTVALIMGENAFDYDWCEADLYRTSRISGTKWSGHLKKPEIPTQHLSASAFLYYWTGEHIGKTNKPLCGSVTHSCCSVPVQSIGLHWNPHSHGHRQLT